MDKVASPAETRPEAVSPYRDPEPFQVTAQGQDLCFFPSGAGRLERLLELIEKAQVSLKLAFYVYADDACGRRVREAITAAARRGVRVSLIVDGFGASVDDAFFAELEEAGGHFCIFSRRWNPSYVIRNHQKIVVADERTAMLGGFNIEEDYFAPPEKNGWRDLAFTVEGSLVERVVDWFDQLEQWTGNPRAHFRDIRRRVRAWDPGVAPVQLLIGGPTIGLSTWSRTVSRDLIRGEKLDMIMAYFAPAYRLRKRIRRIAAKGHTRLILAGKSDNPATIGASRTLYKKLLRDRARIFEFQPCKLHTKLIVLDDTVYLGSANFDMRSLYVNLEIVVRIEDHGLAERLRAFVAEHEPASLEVTAELYREWATPWNRLRWWLSWFLTSVVDYSISRNVNLGL
uniref:phospholipase D-like domain-containing protein n=1 Tax=Altererythrobacter segetis TaxID=1104773 RepID=UPI00140B1EB3|nr:phosphatidylserine/phosphatidylglycerophosphate/cardiolipin synthase family protein [Altererythrobacter segetis]